MMGSRLPESRKEIPGGFYPRHLLISTCITRPRLHWATSFGTGLKTLYRDHMDVIGAAATWHRTEKLVYLLNVVSHNNLSIAKQKLLFLRVLSFN